MTAASLSSLLVRRGYRGMVLPLLLLLVLPSVAAGQAAPPTGRKAAVSPKRPHRADSQQGLRHAVRPGETLWTIARRHGVSVEALARANGLDVTHRVRAGQRLVVPSTPIEVDSQEPPSFAEITLGPPPEREDLGFAWPVAGPIASPFGARARSWHGGIDIRAERGTPIRAAAPGMVIASGRESGHGHVIKIWHRFDFMTVYAHNHENLVRAGDWVERGDVIGTVGNTGRSTAPHLHFEVRLEGKKYDPLFWLPQAGSVDVASSAPRLPGPPR